ncbi:hypothetical protein RJ639_014589 [Escallonia herrerae]|uniref:glutathione transferase n=1 Tax=Escallonia herrerae TaxID=1293975 RepID=A0AA89AMB6_9ASTE|nr:hypothetical protein RJ639_014589 [Escallonia herrerae]
MCRQHHICLRRPTPHRAVRHSSALGGLETPDLFSTDNRRSSVKGFKSTRSWPSVNHQPSRDLRRQICFPLSTAVAALRVSSPLRVHHIVVVRHSSAVEGLETPDLSSTVHRRSSVEGLKTTRRRPLLGLMAVRKVYGSLSSPATLKVLACLLEHDLEFEFVPPFGQVPVYEDHGSKQFESRAIIRCMGHQYGKEGKELIYWDVRKQAVVANWVDFDPPALKLISEFVIKPKKGLAPDEQAVAEAESKLAKVLDVYEARLTKFKYLASDKYTIVDLLHLPNLQSMVGTPAEKLIESRPRVNAWCAEILARLAWVKVLDMQGQGSSP